MSLRHRNVPSQTGRPSAAGIEEHQSTTSSPTIPLRYPEVRAAAAALKTVGDLRRPPYVQWRPHYDLLDWLALFFGFQKDNVRNQREHMVLHLANAQMRLTPPPDNIDSLDSTVVRRFRRKLLGNYSSWCSYLGRNRTSGSRIGTLIRGGSFSTLASTSSCGARRRILGLCLSASVTSSITWPRSLIRFLKIASMRTRGNPIYSLWENAFLNGVVKPIYETIKAEIDESKNGTEPHCKWRNYDDINEYFWTDRCFSKLKWPLDLGSSFFKSSRGKSVGKTGFVERRTFFYLYRSFDRLWVMLALFLQAAIIVAWEEKPDRGSVTGQLWNALKSRDVQGKSFVGRGLREGLVDNIKYSTFWIFVLATKFTFSYFLQVKPMIKPSKLLWNLKEVDYEWHQFFGESNRDMGQLRLRFQFFASAIQFNLMPEEQLLNARGFGNKLKDAIHR
ncbi:hypothetical protein Bca52824_061432 [Brassica carinata]|uniref:1,3-beta-glucan synthase component FKS1-like domain-containing protein n=1 Tax=Brassica carinata TaxID=52824 RepID=A0A8X7QZU6_BRACI|nr:hypothetical protein Bca52824_061432 [Brassica carinata]